LLNLEKDTYYCYYKPSVVNRVVEEEKLFAEYLSGWPLRRPSMYPNEAE